MLSICSGCHHSGRLTLLTPERWMEVLFGRPDLGKVRPALTVVPMGWKSAVTLVQAAVRHIVFDQRFSDTMAAEGSEPTETHVRFSQVCDEVGLPRNVTKQLVGAMGGGIQGGELNGNLGTIKVGRDSKTSRQSAWLCWPKPKSLNTR